MKRQLYMHQCVLQQLIIDGDDDDLLFFERLCRRRSSSQPLNMTESKTTGITGDTVWMFNHKMEINRQIDQVFIYLIYMYIHKYTYI